MNETFVATFLFSGSCSLVFFNEDIHLTELNVREKENRKSVLNKKFRQVVRKLRIYGASGMILAI